MSAPYLPDAEQRGWIKKNPALTLIGFLMAAIVGLSGFIVHLYEKKDEAIKLKDQQLEAQRDKFEKHLIETKKDAQDGLMYWRDLNRFSEELKQKATKSNE